MKSNNWGIYIFWGAILLIVVGLILWLVLPKNSAGDVQQNIFKTQEVYSQTIKQEKNISDFTQQIISYSSSNLSGENVNELQYNNALIEISLGAESFLAEAVTFVDAKGNYGKLVNNQRKAYTEVEKSVTDVCEYIKNTIEPFLSAGTASVDVAKDYVSTYLEKFEILTKNITNFYAITADIAYNFAERGMVVNDLTCTAFKFGLDKANELANLEEINLGAMEQLNTKFVEFFNHSFYEKYFYGTTPESVKLEIEAIGG